MSTIVSPSGYTNNLALLACGIGNVYVLNLVVSDAHLRALHIHVQTSAASNQLRGNKANQSVIMPVALTVVQQELRDVTQVYILSSDQKSFTR